MTMAPVCLTRPLTELALGIQPISVCWQSPTIAPRVNHCIRPRLSWSHPYYDHTLPPGLAATVISRAPREPWSYIHRDINGDHSDRSTADTVTCVIKFKVYRDWSPRSRSDLQHCHSSQWPC